MNIDDKINSWQRSAVGDVDYVRVLEHLHYLAQHLYSEYEPTRSPGTKQFIDRLSDWLDSASAEDDQKLMLQLAPLLLFIGQGELDSLYQAAFDGPIARWLIDEGGVQLDDPTAHDQLKQLVATTWFCEITDSFRIAKFYKLNDITGNHIRVSWATLHAFAELNKIFYYMQQHQLERIVMLEDFVGSGQQIFNFVEFASTLPHRPPVLICPIIICPSGMRNLTGLVGAHAHVKLSPVFVVSERAILSPTPSSGEPSLYADLRDVIERLYDEVKGTVPTQPLYGPFGCDDTGALTLMYTNCPDNVPPIVHHDSDTWDPLFRRSSRI